MEISFLKSAGNLFRILKPRYLSKCLAKVLDSVQLRTNSVVAGYGFLTKLLKNLNTTNIADDIEIVTVLTALVKNRDR